mmetsp:Transcript_53386/g.169733  ORF Transcript_53386/g.169733 Transcript_53386/m.169733 type:complete len:164 (+) Transcript_53386:79-570(+)
MTTVAERKKLKVADLKALLSERGLDTSGLKAALLERLEDAIAKEEAAPAVPGEEQPEAVAEPDPSPQEMDVPEESPAPAPAEDPVPIASATTPAATKVRGRQTVLWARFRGPCNSRLSIKCRSIGHQLPFSVTASQRPCLPWGSLSTMLTRRDRRRPSPPKWT